MAYSTFYTNTSDTDLDKEQLLKSPDIFIMKHIRENTGTLALSTSGDDVITDTNAAFTVDGLISTVGLNLYMIDDNSKLAIGKISDNDATTFTFEADDMLLVEDGVTAPTFTNGETYSYRVLTPSSAYAYGPFLGYSKELSFSSEPETVELKNGIPRELIREDLLENVEALTFALYNVTNSDIIAEVFRLTAYGSQTGQYEGHHGTNSFNTDKYQITLSTTDVNSKAILYQFFKTGLRNTGEIALNEEDYKAYSVSAKLFKDSLRDSTSVNSWMYRKVTT